MYHTISQPSASSAPPWPNGSSSSLPLRKCRLSPNGGRLHPSIVMPSQHSRARRGLLLPLLRPPALRYLAPRNFTPAPSSSDHVHPLMLGFQAARFFSAASLSCGLVYAAVRIRAWAGQRTPQPCQTNATTRVGSWVHPALFSPSRWCWASSSPTTLPVGSYRRGQPRSARVGRVRGRRFYILAFGGIMVVNVWWVGCQRQQCSGPALHLPR